MSSDSNSLDLCTAIQPGIHVRLLWQALQLQCPGLQGLGFETGGEDLPNAYRHVPMMPEQSWMCVVAFWDPVRNRSMFRRYYGHLFGLPLAVTSFNRYPRMLQCFFRRFGACLASMYFDDLTVQDVNFAKGSSQHFCVALARLLGSPFSQEKHQQMSPTGEFLGLWHDVGNAIMLGGTTFWVRDRLLHKVEGFLNESLRRQTLTPGVASKLYGCLTFLGHGCWGKVGRSGLDALHVRQYEHGAAHGLTENLCNSFEIIRGLLRLRPKRLFSLQPSLLPRFLVASDAAQEVPRQGSAGALAVLPSEQRLAAVLNVDERLFSRWDTKSAKISQLELCVVLMTLASLAPQIRGHHGLWFIDNVPALLALVKGRSPTPELDIMAGAVHSILCGLHVCIYWEWIASGDNWSDGASRLGASDEWRQRHTFSVYYWTLFSCFSTCRLPL